MSPCEPEMVLQLSSIKMAWSFSRTKRFRAPTSEYARNNTMYQKYLARPDDLSALSLLEWLRCMNESSKTPKAYKNGSTLVGVQTVSIYSDEYFFQHLLLNHPHRRLSDLRQEILPRVIKFFASAVSLQPSLWTNITAVTDKLETMGNKDSYVPQQPAMSQAFMTYSISGDCESSQVMLWFHYQQRKTPHFP